MAEQMKQNKSGEMAAKQIIPAGYKLTEIGVIPSDWKVINGRELFVKIQDGTHFSPKVNGGEFLYITSKNIRNGFLDLKSAEYIDKCQHEKIYRRCDVTKNDILITKDGANTGNVCLNPLDEPFSLLSSVAFLRLNKKHHEPTFFVQQILSPTFQSTIKDEMSGNAITRLTLGKINGLKFYVPELNEQKAIAGVLSDTDELIAGLEQLIAKKQAIKTATMQQLLTGRTRLPQFAQRPDGTPKGYKTSELGQIPEDWITPTLKGITSNIIDYRGRTPRKLGLEWGDGNILALSAGNVKKGFIDYKAECYFGSDELYKKWMTSGDASKDDIVFTMEAPLGNVALIPNDDKYILSQRTILLQLERSKFLPTFIIQVFLSDMFQSYISESATGSTAQGIKRATFEKMFVAAPSCLEEQTAIATILSDMDSELTALEQKRAKARDLKQGMMQQLLTGRIRLPLEVQA